MAHPISKTVQQGNPPAHLPQQVYKLGRYYIVEGLWSRDDQTLALTEGWFIGWVGAEPQSFQQNVSKGAFDVLDGLSLDFATPAEARKYVETRSDEGSEFHTRAIAAMVAMNIQGHPDNKGKK